MPKTMELTDAEAAAIERMRTSDEESRAESLLKHRQRAQRAIERIDEELAQPKYATARGKLGIRVGER